VLLRTPVKEYRRPNRSIFDAVETCHNPKLLQISGRSP